MEFGFVVKKLKELAPLHLAESWDNVGVLVEPPKMRLVSKILLTNDLTLAVMDEAEEKKVDMILSYHPPLFKPLKAIRASHWKERIIGRCLSLGISLYSPHTAFDAVEDGVNDWLIRPFGKTAKPVSSLSAGDDHWSHQLQVMSSDSQPDLAPLRDIIRDKMGDRVGISNTGDIINIFCPEFLISEIISISQKFEQKNQIALSKLEKVPLLNHGAGRRITLSSPVSLRKAISMVKEHLGLNAVRVAVRHGGSLDDKIRSVAVCAGSGSSVLHGAKVDLKITGEMSHHEVLEATHCGSSVILTEHSNSERGYLSAVVKGKLEGVLGGKVEVVVAEKDEDPLKVVWKPV